MLYFKQLCGVCLINKQTNKQTNKPTNKVTTLVYRFPQPSELKWFHLWGINDYFVTKITTLHAFCMYYCSPCISVLLTTPIQICTCIRLRPWFRILNYFRLIRGKICKCIHRERCHNTNPMSILNLEYSVDFDSPSKNEQKVVKWFRAKLHWMRNILTTLTHCLWRLAWN